MKDNAERNAEIIRRRLAGELPSDIRRAMGISRNVVAGVLDRARIIRDDQAEGVRKYGLKGEQCHKAKLTADAVADLRANYKPGHRFCPSNLPDLAQKYGVSVSNALKAATGRTWKHVA